METRKKRYNRLKEAGVCVQCGKVPSLDGRTMCAECAEKKRQARKTPQRKEYMRKYVKELRSWRKEHHVCVDCGEQDAYTIAGHRTCYECLIKRREKDRARHGWERICAKDDPEYIPPEEGTKSPPKGERHLYGLCENCCKPLDGAKLSGISAASAYREDAYLCKSCYEKAVASCAKMRERKRPAEPVSVSPLLTEERIQAFEQYKARHKELVKEWEARTRAG